MKRTLLLIAAGFIFTNLHAQRDKSDATSPAKAVFFEIGGPGVASLNYDMRFTKSESGIGGRIGIGGFSIGTSGDRTTALFIPIGVNYLLGKDGRHYFEVGGGVTPVVIKDDYSTSSDNFRSTFGHVNIGYRLQPEEGGFFFKASITPVFGKGFFWPYYGGVAFGYKF